MHSQTSSACYSQSERDVTTKYRQAIESCVKAGNIGLAMHLIGQYLKDPSLDNSSLSKYLTRNIMLFIQDKAVNFQRQTLLHLLAASKDESPEGQEAIVDLINLLLTQYSQFTHPLIDMRDGNGKTPRDLASDSRNFQIQRTMQDHASPVDDESVASTASIPGTMRRLGANATEMPETDVSNTIAAVSAQMDITTVQWEEQTDGSNPEQLIEVIACRINRGNLTNALEMMAHYIQDNSLPNHLVLGLIQANLPALLLAKTTQSRTILHVLAMCSDGENSQRAALMVRTILNSFNQMKRDINHVQDSAQCTALHTAVFFENVAVVEALRESGADNTLVNGYRETAIQAADNTLNSALKEAVRGHGPRAAVALFGLGARDDAQPQEFLINALTLLLEIDRIEEAMTLLFKYMATNSDTKLERLMTFIENHPQLWPKVLNVNSKDSCNRNILSLLAMTNYTSEREIYLGLKLADGILKSSYYRDELLANVDVFRSTALGSCMFNNNDYVYLLLALFVKHGANVNIPEGSSEQSPLKQAAQEMNAERREDFLSALEGEIDIYDIMRNMEPSKKDGCVMC